MANLIVDIGNTALKASWCDGITLGKTYRYQGERMLDYILSMTEKERPEILVLSSVRHFSPQNIHKLEEVCDRLLVVDESVLESYGLPLWMTPDRAASIVASRYLFKGRGCTVFDFGTTLTVDFLDPQGQFRGGNISPGCKTRFKSLNRYSKSLPLLDAPEEISSEGHDISSSIESGVISGIMFEIEGYILRNPENINVFTGGDAIYFAKRMKNSIFVVCNLVLMGLALIAVEYDKKD
ncbi:MAG: type III pantothenate kinase [Bacteroidales bacterium]|nr:type III pantothenate kinase [Bacteroidales bacterium]MBP3663444.1 type III pantothenate kinase [Bacteroidales bacterium]